MLLYFSATGNCKYVALRLAAAYNEKAISILDCLHQEQYDFSESTIGIVFPTYFWGLPSLVQEFLEKASFQTDYLYFIATYGTTPGAAGHMAAQAIRGRSVDAFYSVRMPDTWTPLFDLSSPGKVAAFTKTTEAEIDTILRCVQSRYTNSHMSPRVPLLMAKCFAQPFYHSKARRTAHFHVEQSCIGCACARRSVLLKPFGWKTENPYGSKKNVSCVWDACTAAPGLPFNMASIPKPTGSMLTLM